MNRASLFFGCGVLLASAGGWLVFPRVLYNQQSQPLEFRHKTHAEKSGTADCAGCHEVKADGQFGGIPQVAACSACHAEPMGTTPAEAMLVKAYVKTGDEAPWLMSTRQPANVRFSHAIHTTRGGLPCKTCHASDGASDQLRAFARDRISGYSNHTISMDECEDCHRAHGVAAGCLGCHE